MISFILTVATKIEQNSWFNDQWECTTVIANIVKITLSEKIHKDSNAISSILFLKIQYLAVGID
jgi:hypothetical protein